MGELKKWERSTSHEREEVEVKLPEIGVDITLQCSRTRIGILRRS